MEQKNKKMRQWARVAWRNIVRQQKRTVLLGGAIGFAVLVITLVNAYSGGLILAVRENFTQSFGGHIYVSGSVINEDGFEMSVLGDTDVLEEAIARADVPLQEINFRSGTTATLIYTTNETFQIVEGVDFQNEVRFRETIQLLEGSWEALAQPGTILLPGSIVEQLDIDVGEELLFSVNTVTGQRNVVELTLAAISVDVAGLGITSAYVRLADLNEAIGLAPNEFQTANLYLTDPDQMDQATERLLSELATLASVHLPDETEEAEEVGSGPPEVLFSRIRGVGLSEINPEEAWEGTRFDASNLNDATSELETVVDTLNWVAFGIFVVLLLITGVGITNSYRMVMIERTTEIGTMRSIGVTRSGIRAVFTLEALFVALLGVGFGVVAALLLMGGVSLIEWSAGTAFAAFLVKGRLIADVGLLAILQNTAVILIMTIWAVNAPARAAAELEPAQALRTTF